MPAQALALRSTASAVFTGSVDCIGGRYSTTHSSCHLPPRRQLLCRSGLEPELNGLGLDFLKFLGAFVIITPVFKRINVSPILGFLLAGVLLRQAKYASAGHCFIIAGSIGRPHTCSHLRILLCFKWIVLSCSVCCQSSACDCLNPTTQTCKLVCSAISSPKELADIAEIGVLFLLFEMGLELSTDRLRALSTYAFGLGTAQVLATTTVFVAFAYPFGDSVGTWLLQHLAYADAQLASITSWEEAIVIAVALSLSSSAFVLQLLGDKGQLASRSGSATLGVLLLQVCTSHVCSIVQPTRHNQYKRSPLST